MKYQRNDEYCEETMPDLMSNYKQILGHLGEDPGREGLLKTPERVSKAMQFLTQGYKQDAKAIINSAKFHEDVSEMIVVKDIEIYSLCEHHMLPFIGRAHVAYIPNGWITGLSKIARVVDVFSRRLQVQERLTAQIAQEVMDATKAEGVGVVVECRHLCSMMRGVQKQNSIMTTSSVLGSFRDDSKSRMEFLNLIARPL